MDIIENLSEVFELATNATSFTKEILKLKKNNKKQNEDDAQIGSSGYRAQIGSSGYRAKIGSSGDWAKIGSSGGYAKIGSSGNFAQIGSSGDSAQIGSSGDSAQIGSSGDRAQIGSSGDRAQIGSSGDWAKIGSSGGYAKIGSSGDDAKIGSSGNFAQIGSSGKYAVISAIGYKSRVKAKQGSWITLAEYEKDENNIYRIAFVKTEYVDGEKIKEDTEYTLYNKEFHEVIEADGILSVILNKKGNIYKVVNYNDNVPNYLLCIDGIYSHGRTLKEAKESLKYKISNRDTSQYEHLTIDDVVTQDEAIKMYRVITGACEFGTRSFVESLDEVKDEYKISEIIELTQGRYGADVFANFFRKEKKC